MTLRATTILNEAGDTSTPLLSRSTALVNGSKYYFTGKMCCHGHLAKRLTSNCMCVICTKEHGIKNPNRSGDPDKRREINRRYRNRNKDKVLAWGRRQYAKDRITRLAQSKKWKAENRERNLTAMREWRKNNREAVRIKTRLFKSRRRGADGSFTAADIARIRKQQRNRCAVCRKTFSQENTPSIDHIIAIANGGTNYPRNIQLTCLPCNQRKHRKDPIEFSQSLGLLL